MGFAGFNSIVSSSLGMVVPVIVWQSRRIYTSINFDYSKTKFRYDLLIVKAQITFLKEKIEEKKECYRVSSWKLKLQLIIYVRNFKCSVELDRLPMKSD